MTINTNSLYQVTGPLTLHDNDGTLLDESDPQVYVSESLRGAIVTRVDVPAEYGDVRVSLDDGEEFPLRQWIAEESLTLIVDAEAAA